MLNSIAPNAAQVSYSGNQADGAIVPGECKSPTALRDHSLSDATHHLFMLSVSTAGLTLSTLPDDALLQIWIRLFNPSQLARTNRRLCALSQDPYWRSKWFMQRYRLSEVIFKAIARPKLFNSDLFHRLLKLGAPLSRNLVQLLRLIRGTFTLKPYTLDDVYFPIQWKSSEYGPVEWGNISTSAYEAVLQHGIDLVRQQSKPNVILLLTYCASVR